MTAAVCVVKIRGPRVNGKKFVAFKVAYSSSEKSPSGPTATATVRAGARRKMHSAQGWLFSCNAAAILNVSLERACTDSPKERGGKICGRNGFLDCLQASMAICRQRSNRLFM